MWSISDVFYLLNSKLKLLLGIVFLVVVVVVLQVLYFGHLCLGMLCLTHQKKLKAREERKSEPIGKKKAENKRGFVNDRNSLRQRDSDTQTHTHTHTHTHKRAQPSLLCPSIIDVGHAGFPLSHLFSALPLRAPFASCLPLWQAGISRAMLSYQSVNPS